MGLITINPPSTEPITLEEARNQCRVDGTDHDAVLLLCIAGARAKCEAITEKALIHRVVEQNLDQFPDGGRGILLLGAPAAGMQTVTYTDTTGTTQVLDPSAYTLDATLKAEPWLLPAYGTNWPTTRDVINAVRLRYVAGYAADSTGIPDDIRTWLLLVTGYLFAQREAIDTTGRVAELPGQFLGGFLAQHRAWGF